MPVAWIELLKFVSDVVFYKAQLTSIMAEKYQTLRQDLQRLQQLFLRICADVEDAHGTFPSSPSLSGAIVRVTETGFSSGWRQL